MQLLGPVLVMFGVGLPAAGFPAGRSRRHLAARKEPRNDHAAQKFSTLRDFVPGLVSRWFSAEPKSGFTEPRQRTRPAGSYFGAGAGIVQFVAFTRHAQRSTNHRALAEHPRASRPCGDPSLNAVKYFASIQVWNWG